jgi:hypothetical protein
MEYNFVPWLVRIRRGISVRAAFNVGSNLLISVASRIGGALYSSLSVIWVLREGTPPGNLGKWALIWSYLMKITLRWN